MSIQEKKIGVVSHWYSDLHVAAVDLTDGDLHVGDSVGIKLGEHSRKNDVVYLAMES